MRQPDYRRLSLWHDTAGDDWVPRPSLPGDRAVDVAIVGGGLTGLWTAYYLARADPSLRVAVLEREVAGFGASGRNGGWCSALFPTSLEWLSKRYGRAAAVAQHRAMQATVDEVGRVVAAEGIRCGWAKGGTVTLARTEAQLVRARAEVAEAASWGFDPGDLELLDPADASARLRATDVLGATYTPHCAAVHPARLVRGVAAAAERLGVQIYETTAVSRITPGAATTAHGVVRADIVVRATEGYTAGLPGFRRTIAPVYSLMLATEPLPDQLWSRIGLHARETFADHRHLIIYGQRTEDGRIAFGGRGAPYHFGSRTSPEYDREPDVFADLWHALVELLPDLRDVAVTHTWGGPLGISRDWCPSVGLDRAAGIGWAGGYVGDGVAATNLAGRTLSQLIRGESSELTALPWVGHRSPSWEPEPLRWLGVNASLRIMSRVDAKEARTGRQSRRATLLGRLTGH